MERFREVTAGFRTETNMIILEVLKYIPIVSLQHHFVMESHLPSVRVAMLIN